MNWLIHYIVRTQFAQLNFDFVWTGPVTVKDLNDIRGICAEEAMKSGVRPRGTAIQVFAEDVVLANIIPLASGEPKQIGGS